MDYEIINLIECISEFITLIALIVGIELVGKNSTGQIIVTMVDISSIVLAITCLVWEIDYEPEFLSVISMIASIVFLIVLILTDASVGNAFGGFFGSFIGIGFWLESLFETSILSGPTINVIVLTLALFVVHPMLVGYNW